MNVERIKNLAVALVSGLALAGCAARYNVDDLSGTTARLDRSKTVYVSVPQDGAYANRHYPGSGQTVAQAVAAAFAGQARRVQIGTRASADDEAVAAGKVLGADYVVVPVIAHWEHRATAWSGLPSRMSVRLTIFEADTGKQLSSTAIEGRSRVVSWSGTSPESLLRQPISEYVRSLY